MSAPCATACWLAAPGRAELRDEDLPPPLAELDQRFKRYHLQRTEGG